MRRVLSFRGCASQAGQPKFFTPNQRYIQSSAFNAGLARPRLEKGLKCKFKLPENNFFIKCKYIFYEF